MSYQGKFEPAGIFLSSGQRILNHVARTPEQDQAARIHCIRHGAADLLEMLDL